MYSCNNRVSSQPPQKAYIDVLNYGGFVARFYGHYDYNGRTINFFVGGFPIGQERRVDIPVGATNIYVIMEAAQFILDWATICEKTFNIADEYCFVVYGLSILPYCAQIPCTSPGILKSSLPCGAFLPLDSCNDEGICNKGCITTNSCSSNNQCVIKKPCIRNNWSNKISCNNLGTIITYNTEEDGSINCKLKKMYNDYLDAIFDRYKCAIFSNDNNCSC